MKTKVQSPAPAIVMTRSMKAKASLIAARSQAEAEVEYSTKDLATWQEKFAENAAYAFEWSKEAFVSAARQQIAKVVLLYLDRLSKPVDDYTARTDEEVLRITRDELMGEVMRRAKWPEHSTSNQHNEMHLELNAKRAEWVEKLTKVIDRITP